jgi:DNA-binding response OmpR family regulator
MTPRLNPAEAEWKGALQPKQRRLLDLLEARAGAFISMREIVRALDGRRCVDRCVSTADAIGKLRRTIAPHGLTIERDPARGWRLVADGGAGR